MLAISLAVSYARVAGDRPDINTFSGAQQLDLVTQMQNYIDLTQINAAPQSAQRQAQLFALHGLAPLVPSRGWEDYLISQNRPQFVPLPKWNPANCIPAAFNLVDADCPGAGCTLWPTCARTSRSSRASLPVCATDTVHQLQVDARRLLPQTCPRRRGRSDGHVQVTGRADLLAVARVRRRHLVRLAMHVRGSTKAPHSARIRPRAEHEPRRGDRRRLDAGLDRRHRKEPDNESPILWDSPDIWVRNTPATPVGTTRYLNEHQHQNPSTP